MFNIFVESFYITFFAVLKILFIVLAAGVLVRKQIVSQDNLKVLSSSVVQIFLPCLIFSSIVKNFEPSELKIWYLLPISSILMVGIGLLFGWVFFARQVPAKKNMLALTSMQNSGYFVLPMGAVLFYDQLDKFNLYCFLFILGMSPLVWSVGKFLISSDKKTNFTVKGLITPPLIANISAIFFVFTSLRGYLPKVAVDGASLLGQAAVPLAIFVLGGMLGGLKLKMNSYIVDTIKVVLVKLIIVPAVTVAVLYLTKLGLEYPLLGSFLVLEASAAPATANLLQVKHYGGNQEEVSTIMLACYLSCIITVPAWMAVWKVITM